MALFDGLTKLEGRILVIATVGVATTWGILFFGDGAMNGFFSSTEKMVVSPMNAGRIGKTSESQLEVPRLTPGDSIHIYVWKLEDLYTNQGLNLRPRSRPAGEVGFERELFWEHSGSGPFSVQLSGREDFANEGLFLLSKGTKLTLKRVRLGDTFWRVSFDRKRWSEAGHFVLEPRYLDVHCELSILRHAGPIVEIKASSSAQKALSFLAEISSDRAFPAESTEARISNNGRFTFDLSNSRFHFIRARAMNESQEISEPSAILDLN
jgi:hypothetical protein